VDGQSRRVVQTAAVWFLTSKLLRMGVALSGFYLVGGGVWSDGCSAAGFCLARLVTWWLTRSPAKRRAARAPEASYAP